MSNKVKPWQQRKPKHHGGKNQKKKGSPKGNNPREFQNPGYERWDEYPR
jgi:hypothetical protein